MVSICIQKVDTMLEQDVTIELQTQDQNANGTDKYLYEHFRILNDNYLTIQGA